MQQLDINEIKANYRLEDTLSRRYGVTLKSNGSSNTYMGLCPFHQEKTPSFYVYTDEQYYHCYGCGQHGDVLNLIQEKEGIEFKDTIRTLAADSGIRFSKTTKEEYEQLQQTTENERHALNKQVALEARTRYKNAKTEFLASSYLKSKNINHIPEHIKTDYVESSRGVQLIPMVDMNGVIWNLQRIWHDEDKYNKFFLKGARVKGLFYPIGAIDRLGSAILKSKTIVVAEGVATALSLHDALQFAKYDTNYLLIITAFNAYNIAPCIAELRKMTKAEIIIAADNDKWYKNEDGAIEERSENIGLQYALNAAESDMEKRNKCRVIYPEFQNELKPKLPSDFNDMASLMGLNEVAKLLLSTLNNEEIIQPNTEKTIEKQAIKKQKKSVQKQPSQEDNILKLLDSIAKEYWHNKEKRDEAGVTIYSDGYKHFIVNSDFLSFISNLYWRQYGKPVSTRCLNDITNIIRGRCLFEGKGYKVYYRAAKFEEGVYYNLANEKNELVQITTRGWEVVQMPAEIKIITTSLQEIQCMPEQHQAEISLLKKVANCGSDEDFAMLVVYLAYCILGKAPYPVLNIHGSAGSGKSETCKKLLSLIDPCSVFSSFIPEKEEDLYLLAKRSPVLYFDNISSINNKVSDWLCKISTGAGSIKRALFTDDAQSAMQASAGIIINGINDVVERGDLLERSIAIALPVLEKRESTQKLDKVFQEYKPRILGGLFNMMSFALSKIRAAESSIDEAASMPRMIDYIILGTACEEFLNLQKGEFLKICKNKAQEMLDDSAEDDVLIQAVSEIMGSECCLRSGQMQELIMSASDWLEKIRNNVKEHLHFLLPKSPNALSNALVRKESLLARKNFSMKRIMIARGKRRIVISYIPEQ